MARIEHRTVRETRGTAARPRSRDWLRRLPPVGRVFLVLAGVVLLVTLGPVVTAFSQGVTEWWSVGGQLLPTAARNAALVVLPAAVAWARPGRPSANRWLWKGALIVAGVQLARYPMGYVQGQLLQAATEATDPLLPYLANVAISVALALLSVLGLWALSEGLKDAGARSRLVPVVALVAAAVVTVAFFVPSLLSNPPADVQLLIEVISILINGLFLFVEALLAGRAITGASRRLRPAPAWLAGAIGAIVMLVVPLISILRLLVSQLLAPGEPAFQVPFLDVATYFGGPLVALAVAMGMGQLAARAPDPGGAGFVMRGAARYVPAG